MGADASAIASSRSCSRETRTHDPGVRWVDKLCRALEVPSLAAYGMTAGDLPNLVEKAKRASSMKGNSIVRSDHELREIARGALGM